MSAVAEAGTRSFVVIESWVRRHPNLAVLATTLLVMSPAIVAVASNLLVDWHPTGDMSLAELMMRGIPEHPPLVGVAARVGRDINDQGYKPGPSMAYALYPVYLLFARSSIGVIVSTLVVHAVGVFFAIHLARRWFGWWLALPLAAALALMVRALAPGFFLEPWNTWIPVFAYPVFVLLLVGVMSGRVLALPWAVAVGYHCLQTHISYVPLVASALFVAAVWVVVTRWSDRGWVRPMVRSAVVTVVMWLPPVVEQFQPGTGNLRRVWEHFTSPPSETVGVASAVRAMAGEMNLAGPMITGPGRDPLDPTNWWGWSALVVVVLVGVASWWKLRRRDGSVPRDRMAALLVLSTLVGLYATSRVFGTFYDYVIRWMWALTALWLAWSVWNVASFLGSASLSNGSFDARPVESRVGGPRRTLAGVLSAVIVGCAGLGVASSVGAEIPYASDSRLVENIGRQLDSRLAGREDERFLWRWHDPASLGGTGFGMVLEAEKRGITLGVDAWAKATVRPHRSFDESEADAVLWWVVGEGNIERFGARDDAVLLAEYDPRTPEERAESDTLRAAIEERIVDLGHPEWIVLLDSQYGHTQVIYNVDSPPDLKELVIRYNDLRLPGAVFEVPIGAALYP